MEVRIPCICPPKEDGEQRHVEDAVTLPDVLDFRRTLTVRQAIRFAVGESVAEGETLTVAEMTAVMAEAYLLHCIDAWTVLDEKGKALPVTKANVRARLLEGDFEAAETVGNAADDLYSDKVVLPLMARARPSSPPTPTPVPTSATTHGSPKKGRRTRSKPSSISTSPMAVTGPMAASHAGGSSSSLS
jgi:hypothetical protein